MTITDTQIREVLAVLVADVEIARAVYFRRNAHTYVYDAVAGAKVDPRVTGRLAELDRHIAAAKVAIEELDRRAAELVRLRAAGGALA